MKATTSRARPGGSRHGVADADLFGMATSTKRTDERSEAACLLEVMKALKAHPAVAWAERMNIGAVHVGARFVKFGFRGCSDILGQLSDGRLLAVEVKSPKGQLMPQQAIFLERVRRADGVAFVAHDVRDVMRELNLGVPA